MRRFGHSAHLIGLAAASGVLLFLSDHPVHAVALQLGALIPVLWGLRRFTPTRAQAAAMGCTLGLTYVAPLLRAVAFPVTFALPLGLYITLLWAVFALVGREALRQPGPIGSLAVAAIAVLVEWVDVTVVPVWGTAQSWVRVWSSVPWAIQFVSVTGLLGLVFVLVAAQGLLVDLASSKAGRRASAWALAWVVGVPAFLNLALWHRAPVGALRVAAMGWSHRSDDLLGETYEPSLTRAVSQGAMLVVSPEAAFIPGHGERDALLASLAGLARRHRAALVVGFMDPERDDNRIAFIGPDGIAGPEYVKRHLIPVIERYRAGKGERVAVPLAGFQLGGMICQDDNFTDIARGYGRDGTQVVAVPTNDWQEVKDYHFENSLFRAIESGYAVVRAASNGVSAIVSPRGEVLATLDHVAAGSGVIVADVPIFGGRTIYAFIGDWGAVAASLVLAFVGLRPRGGSQRCCGAGGMPATAITTVHCR